MLSKFWSIRPPTAHLASRARPYRVLVSQYSTIPTGRCSSCNAPLPTPIPLCPICKHVEVIDPQMSYHAMFGQPYEPNPFIVDPAAAKSQYHAFMKICHPDIWQNAQQPGQRIAQAITEQVNSAFSVLTNPLSRVEYILRRNGMELDEMDVQEESAEFFADAWDTREEIDNAKTGEDVHDIQEANNGKMDAICNEISTEVEAKNWPKVKTLATRLKYMIGIEKAARDRLFEMG